jgi:alginate O-acetyltransferase complex protein AlgI
VVIGWVFFRSADLGKAMTMLGHLLLPDFSGVSDAVSAATTNQRLVILFVALAIVVLPTHPVTGPYLESSRDKIANVARISLMTAGLAYAAILVAGGTFSPFLYYQF